MTRAVGLSTNLRNVSSHTDLVAMTSTASSLGTIGTIVVIALGLAWRLGIKSAMRGMNEEPKLPAKRHKEPPGAEPGG